MTTFLEGHKALRSLFTMGFIGRQFSIVERLMRGEEGDFFSKKMIELLDIVNSMPTVYGQKDVKDPIVYLHYFVGGANWYITEKDLISMDDTPPQSQAFGLADLFGDGGELGYIPICEILENGGELDFHFTPRALSEVRKT